MKINVGVSNRHCHLTEETFKQLFGDVEITKRNDLNQIGEFASDFTVTIKTEKSTIENVRVLGPFRPYNQVEVSLTDAYKLGVKLPVRASGNLDNSGTITLIGTEGPVTLNNALIVAERHIHMTPSIASELGLTNGQKVNVKIDGEKQGTIEVFTKISDNAYFELHLDTDDANAFMLKSGDSVELIF